MAVALKCMHFDADLIFMCLPVDSKSPSAPRASGDRRVHATDFANTKYAFATKCDATIGGRAECRIDTLRNGVLREKIGVQTQTNET